MSRAAAVRGIGALMAGAMLAFAYAPYGFYPSAVLSIAALFWLWRDASPREAAGIGWLYGVGMFGHGVWWIQVSIHKFGLPLYSFSVTVTVLFVLFLALYPALCGYCARRFAASRAAVQLLLVVPCLWTLLEWVRGGLFSGFPWLLLGYSQIDSALAGYAPIIGVYGVSLVVAVLAGALVYCSHHLDRRGAGAVVLALFLVLGGAWLNTHEWTQPIGVPKSAVLVQGAVPQEIKWQAAALQATLELYQSLSASHWGKDFIVWPETAIAAFPDDIPQVLAALKVQASEAGTALLVGMPTGDLRGSYYNSIVLLGSHDGHYDKHHLVPFGEYLPFDTWLRPVLDFLKIPMSSFSPGPARQPPLQAGSVAIGASICYEDAYASEVARPLPAAQLLVNVSDDAWFGDTIAPHQHLEIARMRARETERYLLRATNTGISAIIDAHGRIVARSPQFQSVVITGDVQPRSGATPFVRYGSTPLLVVLIGVLGVACYRRRRALG